MRETADLVVVGAGPAGSAAAHHASKAGLRTLLLDRQGRYGTNVMPRDLREVGTCICLFLRM